MPLPNLTTSPDPASFDKLARSEKLVAYPPPPVLTLPAFESAVVDITVQPEPLDSRTFRCEFVLIVKLDAPSIFSDPFALIVILLDAASPTASTITTLRPAAGAGSKLIVFLALPFFP